MKNRSNRSYRKNEAAKELYFSRCNEYQRKKNSFKNALKAYGNNKFGEHVKEGDK